MTAETESSTEPALPFSFPYFGEEFSRFGIYRSGWTEPLSSNGAHNT